MSGDCLNCEVLADEVSRARLLSREQYMDPRWRSVNIAVEFTRLWTPDRLYIHTERARGETDEDYAARARRVRAAEERRWHASSVEEAPPSLEQVITVLPTPNRSLFDGRLETL